MIVRDYKIIYKIHSETEIRILQILTLVRIQSTWKVICESAVIEITTFKKIIMKYKMLVLDLDDTLLTDDHTISVENADVV
jgi:hypothetical protein